MQFRRPGFDPWVGKIPWRRAWLPTPVFLPGEFHGQRSLTGYSLWGHKTAGHHLATNTFTLGDKVSQFALLPSPNLNEMTQAIYIQKNSVTARENVNSRAESLKNFWNAEENKFTKKEQVLLQFIIIQSKDSPVLQRSGWILPKKKKNKNIPNQKIGALNHIRGLWLYI